MQPTIERRKTPESGKQPLVPTLVVLAVITALCLIPLSVISYGYMPSDDALRHVAKAVSGRPWQDILVLREGITMDSHPGWHALLSAIYHLTGMSMDSLVVFSVAALASVFLLTPLLFAARAEAWAAALGITFLALESSALRPFYGRPFTVTMAAVTVFCLMARKLCGQRNDIRAMVAVGIAAGLSVWINCTWYLWALPVIAMVLARQWRGAVRTTVVVTLGVFVGACLTGNPFAFLWSSLQTLFLSVGTAEFTKQLVSEYQPQISTPIALVVAIILVWRRARGRLRDRVTENPVFTCMALTWFLGMFNGRFLSDWGLPSFAAWITLELSPVLVRHFPRSSFRRLGFAFAAAAVVFTMYTRDIGERWTGSLHLERLSLVDANDPTKPSDYADWLPQPGGIFYSSMYYFYSTFYANPQAKWKYMVGFEPGWMPEEDLRIYRNIQWTGGSTASYLPWAQKMRPEDRLVVNSKSGSPPAIPGLEWRKFFADLWIGRLPRKTVEKMPSPPPSQPIR